MLRLAAMSKSGFSLFETAIGDCGLAWSDGLLVGVQLPLANKAATRDSLVARFPELAETSVAGVGKQARDAIVASLAGGRQNLQRLPLDWHSQTPFRQRVYRLAQSISRGNTSTYGELAVKLKQPGAARAVGQALGANPFPLLVPCHRVLAAGGKAGGFSAAGGVTTKMRLLQIEGASNADQHGFDYDPYEAMNYLSNADKKLARIIRQVGPPRIEIRQTSSIFVALAQAITYQQLSVKAAATIFARVCDLMPLGKRGLNARNVSKASPAALRGAGLSNNKMLALKDLARRSLAGEIPSIARLRKMDDEAIIEALSAVRGIGRWTVEMMLITRLGRGDVMAVDDLGLRQGHAVVVGKKGETDRKTLMAYAERWRPYRSVASWYLWRAVELSRGH